MERSDKNDQRDEVWNEKLRKLGLTEDLKRQYELALSGQGLGEIRDSGRPHRPRPDAQQNIDFQLESHGSDSSQMVDHGKYSIGREGRLDQFARSGESRLARFLGNIATDKDGLFRPESREAIERETRDNISYLHEIVNNNAKNSKSVYALANESEIPYRQLLYELRIIGFPMRKTTSGVLHNRIEGNHLALFESVQPFIKQNILNQTVKKSWIEAFRRMGWKKNRISQFMQRRVQAKKVPNLFFEVIPPSGEMIERLIKFDFNDRETLKTPREMARDFIAMSKKPLSAEMSALSPVK